MLAEAVCKLEDFTFAPSETVYWQQGRSTERDFIYGTTQTLSHEQLQRLSDEVGASRTLLVVCSAFRGCKEGYPNSLPDSKPPRHAVPAMGYRPAGGIPAQGLRYGR